MKVAVFGGSFNPVHNEHVNIVKADIEKLGLDRVIIMPSLITPAKSGRMFVSPSHRLNMCELAFADVPEATVSDYEISQGGVSYSYITCRAFKEKYPDDERYFIVGGDMFENFDKWKFPEEILKCVTLAVCARESGRGLSDAKENFYRRFKTRAVDFGYTGTRVSSTRIRALAALGESLKGLVCKDVETYIAKNSLYLLAGADGVKKSMSAYRWKHTVGVAVAAAENSARFGVSEKDAVTAALYHDCGKEIEADSQLLKGFCLSEEVPSPVIHQFTGAYLAKKVYGIEDENVLNAVRYHCSGRENMTPLEKLIYLADLLEEGRTYNGVEELREIFYKNSDEALLCALERQIVRLRASNSEIYNLTEKAYRYLKEYKNDE